MVEILTARQWNGEESFDELSALLRAPPSPTSGDYLSEALAPFMEAFQSALGKRGLSRKLYVDDNGSAFRSRQLEYSVWMRGAMSCGADAG
ncbi:MAG: hypothetical protein K0A93_08255 [Desulfuromonadaceae bacterium]|nr:hypothetical protein [Desulfuromonadaceae bacterium]